MNTRDALERFGDVFNQLNASNLELVETIYAQDIHFVDPINEVKGLERLRAYYANIYDGVKSCRFEWLGDGAIQDDQATLEWIMHWEHERFQKGKVLSLPGVSILRFLDDGKVIRHRDYYDMGGFLYERVPLLGFAIRKIKKRLEA
jgi:hypothetical protein